METIKNSISRIHPLVAAAAVSVIIVSVVGTAAITGLLPSSHSAPEAASMNNVPLAAQVAPNAAYGNGYAPVAQQPGVQPVQAAYGQQFAAGQPVMAGQPLVAQAPVAPAPAPAPVVIEKTIIKEVPVKTASHTTHRHTVSHAPAPAPQPVQQQPNYVAIGTGAVVGGLLGNQVGSGNGRKLATVAGVIGGGLIGNQIANQNR